MKKSWLAMLLAVLFFALVGGSGVWAMPLPIKVNDEIVFNDGPGTNAYIFGVGYGGAYWASSPDTQWGTFMTFCLEADEYLSYNNTFYVGGITTEAQRGGVNTNGGDPLDPFTAWIYTQAINGAYSTDQLDDVQYAIWITEGEIGYLSASAQSFYNQEYAAYLASGWSGLGSVRVLNIVDASGNFAQDVLASVPEPGVALLLGMGLLGIMGLGRSRCIRNGY